MSDRTLIKGVPPALGNEAIRAREVRVSEHLALAGHLPRRCVRAQGIGSLLHGAVRRLKECEVALEIEGDQLSDRGAALTEMNRALE